ncbi:exodeoxyribonuclease V subunit alpha [Vogesella sp. LIG4]|uniref:exodeoxyribonuclease V subunit alpha n=1 Tax=Vogesella sp. LIG4 TaxID=1192162 RepID=UPI00081FA424|nr:exodeoxyribonuclease V subunit alpha [Vogesella sp. LIG4]SCK16049.1 DNA helicase/exodeoxyribonuclease V, alpha subunit [Vogesella sp. LIG4]
MENSSIENLLPAQLAGLFARLDPTHGPALQPLLQRLVNAQGAGHVCLSGLSGDDYALLRRTPLAGKPGDYTPLIVDAAGRLYFARQWRDEEQLAAALAALSRDPQPLPASDEHIDALLDALFGPPAAPDWQRLAARLALQRRFLTISGGPGTGKTTTVVRLLAALAALSPRPLVMAMSAPTGKAAARLTESVRAARDALPVADTVRAQLPDKAQTLHRLIGLVPGSARPRHHAANPLPLDVLVVDEASMVDLTLMAQTLAALPAHARLILLGDKDQLASVDAGAVLGDICSRQAWHGDTAAALQAAGFTLPGQVDDRALLADSVVVLAKSHRFGEHSGIGRLARAVNAANLVEVEQLLSDGAADDVAQLAALPDGAGLMAQRAGYWQALDAGAEAAALFAAFGEFMLLAAERHTVAAINTAIEQQLERQGRKQPGSDWYPGRPVMVTRNDYSIGLFNGDIGITVQQGERLRVLFPTPDGDWREVAPARLPEHDTVYAMTVHKSQGSEFGTVWLALPLAPSAALTRALVYTAITRARQRFVLAGSPAVLAAGVEYAPPRQSGLAERLWG